MEHGLTQGTGWIPTGYQAMVCLAVWLGIVTAHAVWRSLASAEPDAIRQAGPIE